MNKKILFMTIILSVQIFSQTQDYIRKNPYFFKEEIRYNKNKFIKILEQQGVKDVTFSQIKTVDKELIFTKNNKQYTMLMKKYKTSIVNINSANFDYSYFLTKRQTELKNKLEFALEMDGLSKEDVDRGKFLYLNNSTIIFQEAENEVLNNKMLKKYYNSKIHYSANYKIEYIKNSKKFITSKLLHKNKLIKTFNFKITVSKGDIVNSKNAKYKNYIDKYRQFIYFLRKEKFQGSVKLLTAINEPENNIQLLLLDGEINAYEPENLFHNKTKKRTKIKKMIRFINNIQSKVYVFNYLSKNPEYEYLLSTKELYNLSRSKKTISRMNWYSNKISEKINDNPDIRLSDFTDKKLLEKYLEKEFDLIAWEKQRMNPFRTQGELGLNLFLLHEVLTDRAVNYIQQLKDIKINGNFFTKFEEILNNLIRINCR